ncbi:MAG: molybdenum cofactor guanylyltransferase [Chloroflexi bacterium]|nr:molybdenum cofactor guanylyltransferase [Chloroflexota bacterium]
MAKPLSGVVLAGGASRRLGLDKAGVTFDGRPLLEIIVERLSGVCSEVIVACGSQTARKRPALPVRFVKDPIAGQGPLAGVQAGLAAAQSDHCLVVACDMPFLNPGLLAYMAGRPRRYQALVPRFGGRWHPLHALYARSCLPTVESLLAQGGNALEELLAHLDVQVVSEEEVRRHDPRGLSLFNLNDARDLNRARAIWRTATATPARPA